MITRTPRTLLALALAASLFFAGCSDDGDDEGTGDGTTTTTTAAAAAADDEYAAWCDLAREGMNATTAEQLASAQAQMEAAPEELKEDYQVVVDLIQFRSENPSDAAGIQQRQEAAQGPAKRVADTIERECGFNPFNPGG